MTKIYQFEPIFENILKEYYTQNLTYTVTSIYKDYYYLGKDLRTIRTDIRTFYQNDDDYWDGKLRIGQKPEVKEIKYSLDPILIKYQEQVKDLENKVKELKHNHSVELEKLEVNQSKQLEKIKTEYAEQLSHKIEEIKAEYAEQLKNIEAKYLSRIQEQEEELIKYSSAKIMTENMFEGIDNSETIRLKSENKELTSQNELLVKQFAGMKKKLETKLLKIQEQEEELTSLQAKLSKQDSIIKKLTAY